MIVFLVAFLIIGFGVGLYFGQKIKNKKKRANELDDEYDYIENNSKESKTDGLYEDKDKEKYNINT